jgi:hypothetical protein
MVVKTAVPEGGHLRISDLRITVRSEDSAVQLPLLHDPMGCVARRYFHPAFSRRNDGSRVIRSDAAS